MTADVMVWGRAIGAVDTNEVVDTLSAVAMQIRGT